MKRLIAGFFAVALVLTLVGSVSAPANAQTMTTAQIMAAIANLQAQLSSMNGGSMTVAQAQAMFNTDLTMGSKNSDVSSLQAVLISKGYSIPAGATGYFGAQTRSAVAAWQAASGISPAAGYFGPVSRAAINKMSGGSTGTGTGTVVCPVGFTCTSTGTTVGGGITTPGVEGTLTITSAPVSTGTVYEGDSKVTALAFKARAQNSDILIQRVKLDLGATTATYNKIFSKAYLTDDSGTVLASIDLNSSNVVKNGSRYEVTLAGFSYVVSKDTTKTLMVKLDVRSSIDSADIDTETYPISLSTTQAVRGVDGAGIDQFGGDNTITKTLTVSASLADSATLTLSTNTNNPLTQEAIAADGANNNELDQVTLLTFDIKADKDAVLLTDLVATVSRSAGAATASSTYLYAGSTQIGSASAGAGSSNATFADIDYTIPKDSTRTFTIKADVRGATSVQTTFTATVANAGLTAENSVGDSVSKSGSATGNSILVRNSGAVFTLVGTPTISKSSTAESNNSATSTATATFQLNIKAIGSAITFGSNASATPLVANQASGVTTSSFVVYRGGAAIAASLVGASSTSFTIPSSGVVNNSPVANSATLQEDQSISFPVSFTFEGKLATGANVTTGNYAVGLENINYTNAAGTAQVANFMFGQTNWRTSEVTLP